MKTFLIFLFLTAVLALDAQTPSIKKSPPLSEASPSSVGMSADRLMRIDAMFEKAVADGEIPGAVALIARKGKIVYHKSFGMADSEKEKPQQKDDIFRIASQTKAITATAVMMLWEAGKFQLDDPISLYIPEFKHPQVLQSFSYADTSFVARPANQEITIRHLLTHTSGIGYGVIDEDERMKLLYEKAGILNVFTTEDVSIGDVVKELAKLPLHHDPGEKFTYSMGLDVLGYFVEVISGMPFDRFLREQLFDPLGMDDTWFYLPDDKTDRLVSIHYKANDKWATHPHAFYDPDFPIKGARKFFSGGGGLTSTSKDYATFLQLYLNGGELNGVRILSRTTVATILANQTGELFGNDQYYGLAFSVLSAEGEAKGGLGSIGTFDWGGYFNTQYFVDAKEQIIGIVMKQTQGPTNDQTAWKFRQMISASIDD